MSRARSMICWYDFDGVKKRICDTGMHDDDPKISAIFLLIENDGDVNYACCQRCLDILRENEDDEEILDPITLLGEVNGFKVFKRENHEN